MARLKPKDHIEIILKYLKVNYVAEHKFHKVRKFRFDWAIPDLMIAIEYEGMFASKKSNSRNSGKSGHMTISGYAKDIEKYNLAVKGGWKLLRYCALNYTEIENDLKELIGGYEKDINSSSVVIATKKRSRKKSVPRAKNLFDA